MANPGDSVPTPSHLVVPRTARYYQLGVPGPMLRDLWIVCHGFSQLAARFAEPFLPLVDDTRLVLVPEALQRFYLDSRPAHTRESPVGATWMTREDRDADIADIVTYLDALYEHAVQALAAAGGARDEARVHALGFSQGAAAVSRWLARGTSRVDHLIVWGSRIPEDVNLAALAARAPALEVDVVYGSRDTLMSGEVVAAQRAVLEASGVPFRMRPFEGGHTLSRRVLQELFAEG